MEERACWICGAGDFTPRLLAPAAGDVVVAADGGLAYLDGAGIVPNQILGDFDSLGRQPKGANVTAYPPEKDDTDMLLAVKYGLAAGCRTPWRICRCSAFWRIRAPGARWWTAGASSQCLPGDGCPLHRDAPGCFRYLPAAARRRVFLSAG